jgi:hypothetical protein
MVPAAAESLARSMQHLLRPAAPVDLWLLSATVFRKVFAMAASITKHESGVRVRK